MYKKLGSAIALVLMAGLPVASDVRADDNDELCSYYGNIGAATVDFLMPLSFQQVVDLIAGKDADLAKELSEKLEGRGNTRVSAALKKLGDDAASLMGESAGYQAFQMAVSGQATTGGEVFQAMTAGCQQAGAKTIIENQRRIRSQSQPKAQ